MRACVQACVDVCGRIDHLSNMAGILRFDHFHEIALADFRRAYLNQWVPRPDATVFNHIGAMNLYLSF